MTASVASGAPATTAPWAGEVDAPLHQGVWDGVTGELHLSLLGDQVSNSTVDLSAADAVERLRLTVEGNSWNPTVQTTPIELRLNLPQTTRSLSVNMRKQTQAALTVHGGPRSLEVSVLGARKPTRIVLRDLIAKTVRAESIELDIPATGPSVAPSRDKVIEHLVCRNAKVQIERRTVSHLRVEDKAVISSSSAPIGELGIRRGSRVQLNCAEGEVSRLLVFSDRSNPSAGKADFAILPASSFRVGAAENFSVAVAENAVLRIGRNVRGLTFHGEGAVIVEQAASDLTFKGQVELVMEDHAQLLGAAGSVRLVKAAQGTIVGKTAASTVDGGSADVLELRGLGDAEALRGVSLHDVRIPVSSAGLQMIAVLQEGARQVTPLVDDEIPGLGELSGPRLSAFRRPSLSSTELLLRSQYAGALADLAATKKAPASTRTKLAWCGYRMRNLVAPGKTERLMLSLYRIIGYGERVIPPLVCYGVVALIIAIAGLAGGGFDFSAAGAGRLLSGYANWLATPLHILKLTSPDGNPAKLGGLADTLARLIVAIPFATAILALRKYVKEDRRDAAKP